MDSRINSHETHRLQKKIVWAISHFCIFYQVLFWNRWYFDRKKRKSTGLQMWFLSLFSIRTRFKWKDKNKILQLLGLLLLTCGIWAWTEKGFFDDIADQTEIPLDPVLLIISIGFVMFILSFAGCLGSLRENICLLKFVS